MNKFIRIQVFIRAMGHFHPQEGRNDISTPKEEMIDWAGTMSSFSTEGGENVIHIRNDGISSCNLSINPLNVKKNIEY